MNELKKELGLVQGVILLTTSLLGTGVFALPELAALAAGDISLWAWPLLIILIFPIAIVFAVLGRHFPHAGGVAHFVGMAFGPRLQRVISWLFLSVIPVSFPAALHIAVGFGQAIYAYVTLNHGEEPSPELYAEVRNWVRKEIGPLATPDVLHWTDSLPKTRSGKIMRRILRKIAAGDTSNLGDTSTLADPGVVEKLLEEKQAIAMPS
ncbi:amino acid permease [Salmonella enterica subsp. enterica serovar Nigeria]|nr:amino acid permease [Salmonella enterica subsp. enterica serovar Nigeria]